MIKIKKIKKIHVSDQVFEKIRELVFIGYFKSDEPVLPERELANKLGVSRTSIRTAITRLVQIGLLKQVQGKGTFIVPPDKQHSNPLATVIAPEDVTIDDILEVRLGLEENAVELAAKRASVEDITALEKSLKEIEMDLRFTGCINPNSLIAFHVSIAFATKNPVFINLVRNLYNLLFVGVKTSLNHMCQKQGEGEKILHNHSMILLAIKNKTPIEARNNMRRHIKYLQDYFLKHRM